MKVFFLLLICLSLYSSQSLVDIYQKAGSEAIEKYFDQELSSQQYWEERLKDINTSFGYFENIKYLLACNKSDSSLKLYTKDLNNTFILNEDFAAFIGAREGDKQKEGDLKTPIGVYKLIQKLNDVDSFYGPLAFVTSYPNTYDKLQGKNGSGIWVHGFPLKQRRDDYTKGCIAINNTNLKYLDEQINVYESLVYIDNTTLPKVSKETLINLLSNLYKWKKAWKENDIKTYLTYYNKDFKRIDGLNYKRFKRYKERIFKKNEYKQILFTDINIISYPMAQIQDVFLISFNERYRSTSYQFDGIKELYVHLDHGVFTILAEK